MKPPELLRALVPVAEALESLGVRYYVGGSLASSARGIARASVDVDLIADLRLEHVGPLVSSLAADYYVSEAAIREAVGEGASFNVIHLDTMLKIDVFVAGDRPFDREALLRARPESLDEDEGARFFPVASSEDIVLAKLSWFRRGGERSERQWTDVLGVLRAAGGQLDLAYLARQAESLRVADLLQKAMADAGT